MGTAPAQGFDLGELWASDRLETELTVETNYERLTNRDLDARTSDGLSFIKPEVSLETGYRFHARARAFTELEVERRLIMHRGRDRRPEDNETEINVKQLYVDVESADEALTVRMGRQEFEDRREWLYDEELDGVRGAYRGDRLSLELSLSRERQFSENLLEPDRSTERINNYIAYGDYLAPGGHRLAAYTIVRDSVGQGSEHPVFVGLRATGEAAERFGYWIELASLRGRSDARRLAGYGLDVGGTYRFDRPLEPSLTLGYAFGSGDANPGNDVDRQFRQTGLEDNSYRFNGIENFRYYGETLDPELSNLSIVTVGLGIRPTRRSSVDIVYHRYLQDVASDGRVEGARVRAEANGESRDVGQAVDLIAGYHEFSDLRLRAKFGYFMPGRAFGAGADNAYSVELGIEFNFR